MNTVHAFGLYWVIADKATQMQCSGSSGSTNDMIGTGWIRVVINIGSCAMAVYIWYLMKQMKATVCTAHPAIATPTVTEGRKNKNR